MAEGFRSQWGWHRLADNYAEELVRSTNVGRNDLVLDIGAGTGAITAPLVATGARVIAIELHAERAAQLRRRYASTPRVRVVRADAADLHLPSGPFRVVANPPFSLTSVLLHRLLGRNSQLLSAHLVMQRAAANRYAVGRVFPVEKSGHCFELSVGRLLPRSAFDPRPKVDAAVLIVQRVQLAQRISRRSRR